MEDLNLTAHEINPKWNYTIEPKNKIVKMNPKN